MKRRLLKAIIYLFMPEESSAEIARTPAAFRCRKGFAGLSLKAVFWATMAVAVALMLGKLS